MNIKHLPHSQLIWKLYNRYYVAETTPGDCVSSHWREFGSKTRVHIDQEWNIKSLDSYGFGSWQAANFASRLLNDLCNFSYFLRLPYKKEISFVKKKIRKNLKKVNAYISYDCFRQICSFITINRHLKEKKEKDFNVLIIGDGHGFFSLLMKTIYPTAKIILFDIGKILLFQCINLQTIFPQAKHFGILNKNQEDPATEGDFIYCPAENIERINDLNYKVIITISAMQEMNYNTIERYFAYMRRYAAPDSLFYCCNRVSKMLSGGERIEFSKYPWQAKDKYLVDEEPAFYRYFLSAKFPFLHFFDGLMRHRLANLHTDRTADLYSFMRE